jgi:hypothetical protein
VAVPLGDVEPGLRVGTQVVGVPHEYGVVGIVHVEQDLSRVPVRRGEVVVTGDPLELDVVVEDRVAVRVGTLGAGPALQTLLGGEHRGRGVGDVDDVDVVELLVVDQDGERLPGLREPLHAVDAVVRLAADRGRSVPELADLHGRERVGDVPDRGPEHGRGSARLVVVQ